MHSTSAIQAIPQMPICKAIPPTQQAPAPNQFNMQIGNIIYEVSVNFKSDASEALDTKIIRIIKNELGSVS